MNPAEQRHVRSAHDSASRSSSGRAFRLRILTFAVVAGGAFAIAGTPALAEILYWPVPQTVVSDGAAAAPRDNGMWLDPRNTSSPQFHFGYATGYYEPPGGLVLGFRTVVPSGSGYIHFYNSALYTHAKFAPGDTIGPGTAAIYPLSATYPEDALGGAAAYYGADDSHVQNPQYPADYIQLNPPPTFDPLEIAYVGFSYLDDSSAEHFGYAKIQVPSTSAPGQVANIFGLAYESTPDTAITVRSIPEIAPATGGSALSLVAGVLAMIEQRRRRATVAA